ncbi:hypothetical protein JRI60_03920 [Archangium violaceum]|uniref:hypothetical protein n=1 Tax=Archangium violaceum TaxID=83451 RepID=UPI00194ECC96|nr:hypothetical protein [Archangium violaceum]QRN98227.1 hypothetical protein JRI60_03920 [Archangium violaceum]
MDALKPGQEMQVAADETMDEFQLTELESRLEMTVTLAAGQPLALIGYCCECVGQTMCE